MVRRFPRTFFSQASNQGNTPDWGMGVGAANSLSAVHPPRSYISTHMHSEDETIARRRWRKSKQMRVQCCHAMHDHLVVERNKGEVGQWWDMVRWASDGTWYCGTVTGQSKVGQWCETAATVTQTQWLALQLRTMSKACITRTHAHKYAYTHTYMHARTHTHTHTQICTRAHTHTYMHTHTHTHIYIHVHTHTHICTHTHIHTHANTAMHVHNRVYYTLPSSLGQG